MNDRSQLGSARELEGDRKLLAHCRSFDPDAPTAQERLEAALGLELARKLLFALAPGVCRARRAA